MQNKVAIEKKLKNKNEKKKNTKSKVSKKKRKKLYKTSNLIRNKEEKIGRKNFFHLLNFK